MRGARYTVKQVSALTGVPAATLRAWERRYAVVEPQRSDSGYRLYDDADVSRLSRMAELVRQGSPASLAAEHVQATMSPTAPLRAAAPNPDAPPAPVEEVVRAGQTYDQQLLTRLLDEAFSRNSFERAVEDWLMPSLIAVGKAWEQGDLDVAGEHFISAAVHRRLAVAFDAAGIHDGAPVAVVGLPPGSLHTLGAFTFAVCLKRQGIDVRFLGADVPLASWTHSVTALRPAAVVISVPMPKDARDTASLVAALVDSSPDLRVWVGGRGASGSSKGSAAPRGGEAPQGGAAPRGGEALPDSVVEAALVVSRALLRR